MDQPTTMSYSYWQGRNGETFTGGDYSEYQRGLREGGHGAGGGLGLIVVLMVVLYVILVALVVAAWAALASLLAALLLVLAMRFWRPGASMPFGFAFRTTFYSTLATMGMSALCAALLFVLLQQGVGQRTMEGVAAHFQDTLTGIQQRMMTQQHVSSLSILDAMVDHLLAHPMALLLFVAFSWGPGYLVSGAIFAKRIGGPFKGLRGYLAAVLTAALCLTPSLLLTNWLVLKLGAHVRTVMPGEAVLTTAAVVSGVALLGYALLGGLVMAILLHLVLRASGTKETAPGFGRNYGTALLGGLVYGVTTAAALFLFPQGDALLHWMVQHGMEAQPFASAAADIGGLFSALWDFLPLQLPGLLLFGGIVVARTEERFRGYIGYLRACAVGGAIALLIFLPFLGLATMGVAGKFMTGTGGYVQLLHP